MSLSPENSLHDRRFRYHNTKTLAWKGMFVLFLLYAITLSGTEVLIVHLPKFRKFDCKVMVLRYQSTTPAKAVLHTSLTVVEE